jgi:hypothetical protein
MKVCQRHPLSPQSSILLEIERRETTKSAVVDPEGACTSISTTIALPFHHIPGPSSRKVTTISTVTGSGSWELKMKVLPSPMGTSRSSPIFVTVRIHDHQYSLNLEESRNTFREFWDNPTRKVEQHPRVELLKWHRIGNKLLGKSYSRLRWKLELILELLQYIFNRFWDPQWCIERVRLSWLKRAQSWEVQGRRRWKRRGWEEQ